ncbi:DNA polymerase III subunit gamma/tau [Leptolyngbya sp. FACHB-321]|uniref:DNA polymerase III subunit gamma/tau n=1 Tax=Leptolyngbya sp. FACHB-321 TaxID=2692807 RepID=UPI0016897920|nr:DNA polymerase III subunit gamma/tau [Leptolyngbya sp. FACHB-321]MBD2034506.1 DNA polymerase III subunit gamma/tau [Leptolyngbya sp. FACHB-321]
MSYQPLHQKYRPQTLKQLVGQEVIATMLANALRQQRIAPAYLFTGARGTGKTSSARILAKSLNCFSANVPTPEPCGTCSACISITKGGALDVIEIDAASHTGVDNIRELIEQSQFQPMQYRYKVYCIDETHMLSNAASNALLKTLEEPPERVVFVLATTDPQKLLQTLISRCQRFDFQRLPTKAIAQHLKHIANAERIAITDSALMLVAQIAQGGLRDAETLLDQLSLLSEEITPQHVWQVSGGLSEPDLLEVLSAILQPELSPLKPLRRLCDQGRTPVAIVEGLLRFLTDLQQLCTTGSKERLYASLPTTVAQLSILAKSVSVPQLQLLSVHLSSAIGLIRLTSQPVVWLERCILDLAVNEQVTVTAAKSSNRLSDLDDLWQRVVEHTPPNQHRLLQPIKLVELQEQVATLDAPTPVASATVKAYSKNIENAFKALGYSVALRVHTQGTTRAVNSHK